MDQPTKSLGQAFLTNAYQTSQSLPRKLARDTYEELLAVGAINTITSIPTRQRLAQYYRSLLTSESVFLNLPSYQNALRSTMPYEVQSVFRSTCANTFETDEDGSPVIILQEKCDLGLAQEQINNAVEVLKTSNIKPHLIRVLADIDVKLQIFQIVIDRAQELSVFLEEAK